MAVKKTGKFDQRPLGLNDEGNDVLTAQGMLAKTGSKIKESGIYSIGMVTAVKTFQKKNGLAVTGKIDQKTWDKLVTTTKAVKRTAKKPAAKAVVDPLEPTVFKASKIVKPIKVFKAPSKGVTRK